MDSYRQARMESRNQVVAANIAAAEKSEATALQFDALAATPSEWMEGESRDGYLALAAGARRDAKNYRAVAKQAQDRYSEDFAEV